MNKSIFNVEDGIMQKTLKIIMLLLVIVCITIFMSLIGEYIGGYKPLSFISYILSFLGISLER